MAKVCSEKLGEQCVATQASKSSRQMLVTPRSNMLKSRMLLESFSLQSVLLVLQLP